MNHLRLLAGGDGCAWMGGWGGSQEGAWAYNSHPLPSASAPSAAPGPVQLRQEERNAGFSVLPRRSKAGERGTPLVLPSLSSCRIKALVPCNAGSEELEMWAGLHVPHL